MIIRLWLFAGMIISLLMGWGLYELTQLSVYKEVVLFTNTGELL